MKPKTIFKLSVDLAMAVLLVFQMAFQVSGQQAHEWAGTAMIALFLAHNLLNVGWYKNLFTGTYTAVRIFRATVNLLVLVSVISLAISGAVMSGYVLGFLTIDGAMALARLLHLAASSWAFVLMSMHLGLHGGMIHAVLKKPLKQIPLLALPVTMLRIAALAIAGYGAWAFYKANMASYMFVLIEFAFLDYEKSPVTVFADHIAMMGLWICIGHYAAKLLKNRERHGKETERRTWN
ncbi:MAG: hypothetical protein LBT47_07800 [Deltaproteobacteria bacterium]|jgi:hypothetical protein|nr:hypothetical protein [Deltaproteobacteria bacterium]